MSDPTPAAPASATADAGAVAEPVTLVRPRRRLNGLAVAAFVLALLLSPFAALFGHIAAGQIHRSNGAERGAPLAWTAVGLGYLWLAGAIFLIAAIYQAFTAPLAP